ncbi:Phage tail tube protein, GTA-gp10 [Pseudosulfitobacter pseudonitzschiae]|uniref:Uncharacterized protein n=1 Tax=Pseudosulfitobacter pseudonitzschiae TaxID=1402135 RepID=A0A073IX07_9RHOB|nr:GTA-gp10 family protein [Pseudosulfitobacter pseudonitzschiae]KEJ93986.1 hypothetical protein SUH3_11995 [Pseudosulfitobacter pseudonitzschiae]SHG01740.1 Phage tail tube protein, GTA-gp10 [Pseudosulfitobacter pseudonitzschiae]
MANKVRGQIAAKFQGEKINLVLSTNSICELEDATDQGIDEFLEKFMPGKKVRMKDLRLMFWALMLDERPGATIAEAGALIDELRGDHDRIMTQAILAAFPDAEGDTSGK